MSGGGIGSALGTGLGIALAPATGGMSMIIPALTGAAGGFLGGKLTHSENPLMDAILGGVGGGLGGYAGIGKDLGISNALGMFDDAAPSAASAIGGVSSLANPLSALTSPNIGNTASLGSSALGDVSSIGSTAANAANAASSTPGAGLMGYLSKQNPLNLALAGGSVLSGIDSLTKKPKVDVAANRANVLNGTGFNGELPKYTMQNTATPYSGDWYKYGETPQAPMYNAQPVRAMARGGKVNPLAMAANTNSPLHVGMGKVMGSGGGHDDKVPANLSQGEYVIPAEVVSQLGDGSTDYGAKKLDDLVHNVRSHKTRNRAKFAPKAKNPLSYLPKTARV